MNKRFFAAILALALALALLPGTALAATQTNVPYMKLGVPETCPSATVVGNVVAPWYSGWYVVNGAVTVSARIDISGDVHLILADGAVLTAAQGSHLQRSGSRLSVYGQSAGTGRLDAAADLGTGASIGCDGTNCGTLTLYGGNVTATSSSNNIAGFGGGYAGSSGGNGGTLTVYGGTFTASNSGGGKAIGGGIGLGVDGTTGDNTVVTVGPSAGNGISVRVDGSELAGSPFFAAANVTASVNGPAEVVFSEVTPNAPVPNAVTPGAAVPETGDSARPWLCAGLMLLALAGYVALKKRQA